MITEYTVLPLENAIQIKSVDEQTGVVHYKVYAADQKEEFLIEVEGAALYAQVLGW